VSKKSRIDLDLYPLEAFCHTYTNLTWGSWPLWVYAYFLIVQKFESKMLKQSVADL